MLHYACICVAEAFGMLIIVFWRNCSWSIFSEGGDTLFVHTFKPAQISHEYACFDCWLRLLNDCFMAMIIC